MIDDCWRRAREVAARVLTNDMLKKRIMRDGRGGGRGGEEMELARLFNDATKVKLGAVAKLGISQSRAGRGRPNRTSDPVHVR